MNVREVDEHLLADWPLPEPGEHKRARGRVAVIGGSATTPGSALLAGEAALRVGAGKLRIATALTAAAQLGVALPESAVRGFAEKPTGDLDHAEAAEIASFVSSPDVSLLGPGFVDPDDADRLLSAVLPLLEGHVVVDALGSAYFGRHPEEAKGLGGRCVLTANPDELAHVLRVTTDEVKDDPRACVAALAASCGSVVVCGGEQKVIATPEGEVYVVGGGGPGLGVSGSGDVHAGLVTGLLARTGDPAQAAVWGAWLHATAGDVLAREVGEVGFLARELLPLIPRLLAQPAHQPRPLPPNQSRYDDPPGPREPR